MAELWQALKQLFLAIVHLVSDNQGVLWVGALLLAWVAWWLWCVNWQKAWPVLARGAWLPVVLLLIITALVWSQLAPKRFILFGIFPLPNFWGQLGAVGLFSCLALACGWLQGYFGWTPEDMTFDPPAHADHGDGHGHGHEPATHHGASVHAGH